MSVLSERTDLQVLDVGGHAITAGSVNHLVVLLSETNRTIEELSLADNGLSSQVRVLEVCSQEGSGQAEV